MMGTPWVLDSAEFWFVHSKRHSAEFLHREVTVQKRSADRTQEGGESGKETPYHHHCEK
jgi:hypothetical protein